MTKPIRPSKNLIVLLMAAAALSGCANAPTRPHGQTAEALITSSPPPSTPETSASAGSSSEGSAAANELLVQKIDPPAFTDHSFVSPLAPDLFLRLRAGFKLQDVDEPAIDRELNWYANHPDYLERTWNRAEHYLHYIVQQLNARSMPLELALLPVVESAFDTYAYSRARASGLWQFIPDTGSNYGLKQNWWYDGRRDVVASTRAALDYLQSLHDSLGGDWLVAIAAYNCGEGAVQRAVNHNLRLGKPVDFWHLKLPTETRAYVPKLLAMRRIVAKPAAYGLEFSQIDDVPYFTQVSTGGQIDLEVAAKLAGMTKEELYALNPAFHRWATDPTGPFTLLVPSEVAEGLEQAFLTLTPEQRMRVTHYQVQRGDTLAAIAKDNSTTPELLRQLNGLGADEKPVVGSTLMVPSNAIDLPEKALRAAALVDRPERMRGRRSTHHGLHVVRRGDTLYALAHSLGTDVHTLARLNNMAIGDPLRAGRRLVVSDHSARPSIPSRGASTSASSAGRQVTYTVRSGDTLYGIARLLQVTLHDLLGWNDMSAGSAIRPGQKLVAFISSHS